METFGNASDAYSHILAASPPDISIIILDVMLRQGDNDNLFSDAATKQGLDTGLVLARLLHEASDEWCRKLLLFSRANQPEHVERIRSIAKSVGARYLRKQPANQGKKFLERLKELKLIGGQHGL